MSDTIVHHHHKDTIPVKTAIDQARNWRMLLRPFMHDHVIRGFYIPIQDIIDLAKIHKDIEGVRAYLLLPDPRTFSSVKIGIVPVGKNGKDICSKENGTGDGESTVYDFTQPCPHLCDKESPLY